MENQKGKGEKNNKKERIKWKGEKVGREEKDREGKAIKREKETG